MRNQKLALLSQCVRCCQAGFPSVLWGSAEERNVASASNASGQAENVNRQNTISAVTTVPVLAQFDSREANGSQSRTHATFLNCNADEPVFAFLI
jgi:hypothetical protein